MVNVMSYASEYSPEVRSLSASKIELVAGDFSESLVAAIRQQMFGATIPSSG